MDQAALDRLVNQFAENVVAQDRAIWKEGNWRKGNRHAGAYIKAFARLRSEGDRGREALAVLLEHPDNRVRTGAAAYLLRYVTDRATAVLREVAETDESVTGLEARECLERWEEGTWQLDPE